MGPFLDLLVWWQRQLFRHRCCSCCCYCRSSGAYAAEVAPSPAAPEAFMLAGYAASCRCQPTVYVVHSNLNSSNFYGVCTTQVSRCMTLMWGVFQRSSILLVLPVLAIFRGSTLRILLVLPSDSGFDTLDTACTSYRWGSILWVLPVLEVFWYSLLLILWALLVIRLLVLTTLPLLAVFQDFILRGAAVVQWKWALKGGS